MFPRGDNLQCYPVKMLYLYNVTLPTVAHYKTVCSTTYNTRQKISLHLPSSMGY